MSPTLIFYAVFCQVMLTFVLLYVMGRSRVASVNSGDIKIKDIALGQNAWSAQQTQFSNSYHSQFQLPVLFYVVCIFAQINGQVDMVMIALAWGFVVMRIIHAWIHVTTNNVRQRFYAFMAGLVLLVAMWVNLVVNLSMSGGN